MMNFKKHKSWALWICSLVLLVGCTNQTQEEPQEQVETSSHVAYDDDDYYQEFQESEVEKINLSEQSGTVTISKAGTYRLYGELAGNISIAVGKEDCVRLILDGVNITSSDQAAISCTQAKKLILSLPAGTTNTICDGAQYVDQGEDAIDAAIFAQDDLTINGSGTLKVSGAYQDGIKTKDTLKLMEGTYEITAVDDAIIGKDYIYIHDGCYTLQAGGDGLKTTYDNDEEKGDFVIEQGQFTITTGNDGIESQHDLTIYDGTFVIESGGGSVNAAVASNAFQPGGFGMWQSASSQEEDTPSAKGIKAGSALVLHQGNYVLDCSDDAIHANGDVTVNGGNYTIDTGDDGMHADATLTIQDGTINIEKSYEGLEGSDVSINGGYLQVTSRDDGINAAGGSDGDNEGQPSPDHFASGDHTLSIHGGSLQVDASGDGLDSNGSILMDAGTVIVFGPEDNNNAALDYDTTFEMNGGILIATGSSGMAQATSQSSTQAAIMVNLTTQSANTIFSIRDEQDQLIIGVAPTKAYSNLVISCPAFQEGQSISLTTGGNGSVNDKGYIESEISGGTLLDTLTIDGILTTYGNAMMNPGGQGMGGQPQGMGHGPMK